ncbi:histidine phosphatase family protein [uncultured Nevskia sp.]|uniref:histidine phosphatase family protein n=1 Tax=uncultured Nevskia sp. TaxID=228950 RepID=UPI0025DEC619|nr:histidine phosphatase family protein [uncultured Nevskia sp.]
MRIYLIRHGQTDWALAQRHTGLTDIALNEFGERQARSLAKALGTLGFTKVLTSPLKRARQTCALAGQGAAAEADPDLAEWNYGDYEGWTTREIQLHSADWNVFSNGCPNGETAGQISMRADRVIARLIDLSGNIAVFSHGHFGRALAVRWLQMPLTQARHFALDAASVSVLALDIAHAKLPIIAMWNLPATAEPAVTVERLAPADLAEPAPAIQRWENEGGEILHGPLQSNLLDSAA